MIVQNPDIDTPANMPITMRIMTGSSIAHQSRERKMSLKVRVNKWNTVAEWRWDVKDEDCGICRCPFNGCPPKVKYPGDDCPPGV
jgi:hypothetical protein